MTLDQLGAAKNGLVEAATNSVGGYPIGFIIGLLVLPLSANWIQKDPIIANLAITSLYVTVSFVRSYLLRRFFSKSKNSGNILFMALSGIKKLSKQNGEMT